ncbi:transglycosylase domain-containing protein [Actinacidiphila paucisporea]|uniref:Membrane carboxypeptidase (Penicillin-binding protein) n=1 Tax=Actinacidiphila paucisporea TaxID=310782 RepID=A0A1M6WGX9_9ACTN|nr:transglycosylase domain-containing protein [Actinacidiphila paucisporea]SHK92775.1 Membrane carboxypeptidase (penicillin-binding protein) [Actinacidiphila paucisporea]
MSNAQYGAAGGGSAAGGGRPRRSGWRRLLPTWRFMTGTVLGVVALLLGGFFVGYALVSIPDANAAAVAQSNVYYYADGKTELARDGAVNRQNVSLAEVAATAQHAVLSAEDRNFYHESAVSPKAMLRAAYNTATGKGRQSGSTITQQYVKNYYLNQNQTASRKVKEFFIAIKLDRNVSKDQILEGYLNTSYYGRNAYGIQAASQAYFDENASELTTAQGAYLATLLNAPSEFDLAAHPESAPAAKARWNYVLDGMVKEHWLTASQRGATHFPAIGKPKPTASKAGQRGYIVEAVNQYLDEHHIVDSDSLRLGGYRIVTSIQKPKEDAFVTAAQKNIYDRLGHTAADKYVRAGGASIDPATGDVVALYGGIDYTKQYVSSATNATYPPGSTFKPVVLTAALQHGSKTQDGDPITPTTVYDGENKRPVVGPDGPVGYAPENEDKKSYGRINVTRAMDQSVNAVYAQMAQDVGTQKVIDTAGELGMPDDVKIPTTPAMALGSFGASPLDMAQVYATLADHGRQVPYTLVLKVTKDGNDLTLPKREARQTVPREAADTVTSVLRSVVESPHGTATAAQDSGWPSAAKTGTAENDIAAWFAGYTPKLATVVAVLGMNPDTGKQEPLYHALDQARINGGGAPGKVWASYTAAALRDVPVKDFDLQVTKELPPDPQESDPPATDQPTTSQPTTSEPPPSSEPPASSSPSTPPAGTTEPTHTTGPTSQPPPDPTTAPPTLNPVGGIAGGTRPTRQSG